MGRDINRADTHSLTPTPQLKLYSTYNSLSLSLTQPHSLHLLSLFSLYLSLYSLVLTNTYTHKQTNRERHTNTPLSLSLSLSYFLVSDYIYVTRNV